MMLEYRKYPVFLKFGGMFFHELWIDPHYEEGHRSYMDDQLILRLVRNIYNHDVKLESTIVGYKYFKVNTKYDSKSYRLIVVVPTDFSYLGVRSAFRIKESKNEENKD
jgi:hypothetical protein